MIASTRTVRDKKQVYDSIKLPGSQMRCNMLAQCASILTISNYLSKECLLLHFMCHIYFCFCLQE